MKAVDVLELLKPYDLVGCEKIRLGVDYDGGYVVADRIEDLDAVISCGIGGDVSFDLQMAERVPVFQYDHTIDAPPASHANFRFHRQGLGGCDAPPLATLCTHLARSRLDGDRLLLKADIEGAEWDVLAQAPLGTLGRFQQIVFELHFISRIGDARFARAAHQTLSKLNERFRLIHVHANNFAPIVPVQGTVVPDVLELTYVRRDLFETVPSRSMFPTRHDRPNNYGHRDHLLWFYPFLPAGRHAARRRH